MEDVNKSSMPSDHANDFDKNFKHARKDIVLNAIIHQKKVMEYIVVE